MNRMSRFATTVLVSGALGLAASALGAGTAEAAPPSGPYTWCQGRPRRWAGRPVQFTGSAELGLEYLPHLVQRQLGSGQCFSDYLGRTKSAT